MMKLKWYGNEIQSLLKCPCGKDLKFKVELDVYFAYCPDCLNITTAAKTKKMALKKYKNGDCFKISRIQLEEFFDEETK